MAEPLEQEEDKRPGPPVVAVEVTVVFSMTATQAARYAQAYELDGRPGAVEGVPEAAIEDFSGRDLADAVLEALAADPFLGDDATITAWAPVPVPVGKPFPGFEEGYVTGLCGHRVARSEWSAGFRCCEHCAGSSVTSDG